MVLNLVNAIPKFIEDVKASFSFMKIAMADKPNYFVVILFYNSIFKKTGEWIKYQSTK
jgi:hypothetical protein